MIQKLLFFTLVAIVCCGCVTKKVTPSPPSQKAESVSITPTSSIPEAATAQAADNPGNSIDGVPDSSGGQNQYVSFPAVGVKLLRPDGFDDAENFHGFQQESTQSSVMVLAMEVPFSESTAGFDAKQFRTKGMTLVSKENIEIDGSTGFLINVTQTAYGTEYAKWVVVFGDEKKTTMVTATFPKAHEAALSAQLKSVVLSTKHDNTPPPPPGSDVDFTIVASDKLKLTPVLSKTVAYTKDGIIPQKSPKDPLFGATRSFLLPPMQDKRQFATQELLQTAETKVSTITSTKEITIDSLNGFEIEADAEDAKSGIPLIVYQVILFEDDSYIVIKGLVGAELSADYLPEFKKMAHSLTRQPK